MQSVPTVRRIKRDDRPHVNFRNRCGQGGNGRAYDDQGRDNNSRTPPDRPCPQRGQ
jgi:hypothetical protein